MPGKYDNAFPNAQKVQIFEQVDTYIENTQPECPAAKPQSTQQPPPPAIYNINQVGNLNTGPVTIQGNQIGEQTP